jgi:TonB-dependent receptor
MRIDSSNSVHFPSIAQVAGADIGDYNRGSVNFLDRQLYEAWDDVYAAKLNVKRTFDARYPFFLKTGLRYRGQEKTQDRWKPRWSYRGGGDLNRWRDDGRRIFPVEGRYQRWVWPNFLAADREIDEFPERFTYNESRAIDLDLKDDFEAGERIYASYLMGSVVTGRLTTLAGVRVEKTETYGTNRGQDEAFAVGDPRRYASLQSIEGGYTNTFPGLHLRYAVTPRWVFRASASTSIGRPNFNRLFPGMRVRDRMEGDDDDDDDIPRIEMNNPDIKPQFSDNYDFSSEYYFGRGVGMVSVGLFRKELSDFIFTYDTRIPTGTNNGFNGEYENWVLRTRRNGGWARVDGLELNYQQQLSFLPGFLNGFGLYANMTFLRSRGTYDGEIIRDEIQGFTDRSANAGISYIKHGFTIRASANYNGGRLTNYDDNPMELVYDGERTSVDFSIKYAIRRLKSSVYLDVNNPTNSKRTKYQAYESRQLDTQIYGMRITAGISGEF